MSREYVSQQDIPQRRSTLTTAVPMLKALVQLALVVPRITRQLRDLLRLAIS